MFSWEMIWWLVWVVPRIKIIIIICSEDVFRENDLMTSIVLFTFARAGLCTGGLYDGEDYCVE